MEFKWVIDKDRAVELNLRWNCFRKKKLILEFILSNKLFTLWVLVFQGKKSTKNNTENAVSRGLVTKCLMGRSFVHILCWDLMGNKENDRKMKGILANNQACSIKRLVEFLVQ